MTQPFDTAMVFAAGLGKRLRPLTETLPKPLVAVGGKAMLDHALDLLAAGGVNRAVVNAAYLKEQIVAHLAPRQAPEIILSLEEAPLETGGGVMRAMPHLGARPFFAMNSDIVLLSGAQHPLSRLAAAWEAAGDGLDALLLVQPREQAIGYEGAGDFFLEPAGRPRFRTPGEAWAPYVFTGVQLLHPRLFATAPEGAFSLNVLYRRLCTEPRAPRIGALLHDGDWLHVGDAEGLRLANGYFSRQAT